jgi:hypothetical protein
MPSTLNSDNGAVSGSAGLKYSADSTGVLALQTNGTTAVTISTGQVATFAQAPVLPAASIPQAALASNVAGNGPAFSAYMSTNQAAPSLSVFTKVIFDTELYDTNSNFSSSRFTPTVAGYYQLSYSVYLNTSSTALISSAIYKNGSIFQVGFVNVGTNPVYSIGGSSLVYLNGSTDYVEIYIYLSNSTALYGSQQYTYFQGFLARSA